MGRKRWEVGGGWRCREGDVGRVEERYVAGGREDDPMLMIEVMKVGRAVEEADEMILVGVLVWRLELEG